MMLSSSHSVVGFFALFHLAASAAVGRAVPPTGCKLKANAPEKLCNQRGHSEDLNGYNNPNPILVVKSFEECRDISVRQFIPSFSYNKKTHVCRFYLERFHQTGVDFEADPKSNSIYYDTQQCFDCPVECPSPIGQNLLINGDFELNKLVGNRTKQHYGPWMEGSFGVLSSPGHNSPQGWTCNPQEIVCQLMSNVQICANQTYHAQFDYKLTGSSPKKYHQTLVEASVGASDHEFIYDRKVPHNVSVPWTTAKGFVSPQPQNYVSLFYIQVIGGPGRTFQVDNAKVFAIS